MPATGRLTFTTTHRMINRVHYYATDMRFFAHPSFPTGLADTDILMLVIADLTYRGHALDEHFAHFP